MTYTHMHAYIYDIFGRCTSRWLRAAPACRPPPLGRAHYESSLPLPGWVVESRRLDTC